MSERIKNHPNKKALYDLAENIINSAETASELQKLSNKELGELLINEVWSIMKLFGRKSAIVEEAIERLMVMSEITEWDYLSNEMQERIINLERENELLKAALQKIKNWCCVDIDGGVETIISEFTEQALNEVTK